MTLSVDDLVGRTFRFCRATGERIALITLMPEGVIKGHYSRYEHSWSVEGHKLLFRNATGTPTTVFDPMPEAGGRTAFQGAFLPRGEEPWHTLHEIDLKPAVRALDSYEAIRDQATQIFVAAHKSSAFPDDPGYIPIHVGKELSNLDLNIVPDNIGHNISSLNPYFCEMTALYFMWKNSNAAVKGLVHYRRYFKPRTVSTLVGGHSIAASTDFDEIERGFDLIIAGPMKMNYASTGMPRTVEQQYSDHHVGMDLPLVREAIETLHPGYVPYWDALMRSNSFSICNLMVGRSAVVDDYCEWLFEILFLVEKWIPYRDYPPSGARVFGYLAERLLNVWVARNRRSVRVAQRAHILLK